MDLRELHTRKFLLECEVKILEPKAAIAIPEDLSDVSVALLKAYRIQLSNLNKAIDKEQPKQTGQGALF